MEELNAVWSHETETLLKQEEGAGEDTLSTENILEQMDQGGIGRAVLFAVYAPRTVGITTNETVIERVEAAPDRLMGFASVRTDRWSTESSAQLAALDTALRPPGMVGVKMAPAHMHARLDDSAYWGIYEVAARNQVPVYLHTGPSPFPGTAREPQYTHPAYAEATIAAFPGVDFILGHMGYDFIEKEPGALETCIELAKRYDNVWVEPSAMGSEGSDPEGTNLPLALRRFREEGLVDRVLYGSDGPQAPGFLADYLDRTLTAFEKAGYTAAEAEAVLGGNFDALFGEVR